jgi:hypothetical protein
MHQHPEKLAAIQPIKRGEEPHALVTWRGPCLKGGSLTDHNRA